jgi:hypothetical protein
MRPKWTHKVKIETPAGTTKDPETGNPRPSSPQVQYEKNARISQQPVANVGSQVEISVTQVTVISTWTIQVDPSTVLTSSSVITDDTGRKFQIQGDVARRPDRRPDFLVAQARLISDMQA